MQIPIASGIWSMRRSAECPAPVSMKLRQAATTKALVQNHRLVGLLPILIGILTMVVREFLNA
jgi:hypothetical protein